MNVYKHYNQDQLDYQYNTRLQVPEYATYFDRWERLSRQTELHNTILKDISYGTHPEERLDIYPCENYPIQNTWSLFMADTGTCSTRLCFIFWQSIS